VTGGLRVLQVHNHHATTGGDVQVMAHERGLLESSGHEVDEYVLPSAETLDLAPVRAAVKTVWNVEAGRALADRIAAFRPDVVHVHDPYPLLSPAVFRVSRRAGVPSVVTQHAYRYTCVAATHVRDGLPCEDCVGRSLKWPAVKHRCYHESAAASTAVATSLLVHRGLRTFSRDVSRFIALTEFGRDLLVRDGLPPERVAVKPNSVDDPGMAPEPTGAPYVVFAGRLVDIKGVRTLLDAWRHVGPGLDLVVAGDGPLRELVESRAADVPSIRFLGWQDQHLVRGLMAGAEATLVPSEWYEGLPLTILQSLGAGTPVVVSDMPNLADEVGRHGAGIVFRAGDARSLGSVLASVARDPAALRALRGAARRAYTARYRPELDLERLVSLYRTVIAEGPAGAGPGTDHQF
jgi:glycosyltransferase involved in cell wall biosynthesis